jgi:hypothetical protein
LGRLTELRGEFTIVMAGQADVAISVDVVSLNESDLYEEFCRLTESGSGRRAALSATAARFGLRSRDAYAVIERSRNS